MINKDKQEQSDSVVTDEKKVALPHKSAQKLAGWHKRCASDGHCIIPTDPDSHKMSKASAKPMIQEQINNNAVNATAIASTTKRCTSTAAGYFAALSSKKSLAATAEANKKQNNVTTIPSNKKPVEPCFTPLGFHKKTVSELPIPANKENASTQKPSKYQQYQFLSKNTSSKKPVENVLKVTKGYFAETKLQADIKALQRKVPCTVPSSTCISPKMNLTNQFEYTKENEKLIEHIKSCIFFAVLF